MRERVGWGGLGLGGSNDNCGTGLWGGVWGVAEHIDPLEKSVNALMEGLQGIQVRRSHGPRGTFVGRPVRVLVRACVRVVCGGRVRATQAVCLC